MMNQKQTINRYIGKSPQEFKIVGYCVSEETAEGSIKYKNVIAQDDQSLDITPYLRWKPALVKY